MPEFLLSNFILWTNIVIVLAFTLYQVINHKEYSPKEFFIQMGATIVFLSLLMSSFYYFGTDIYQKEIFGGKVVEFVNEEPWTEEYDCSYQDCTTDSKGNQSCRTVHKTCTTRHSEEFYLKTSNSSRVNISSSNYNTAKNEFRQREVSTHRTGQTGFSKLRGEGDIWYSYPDRIIPTAETHIYKNYLMGSKETIQKKNGVTKFAIEEYPVLKYNKFGLIDIDRVVGRSNPSLENGLNLIAAKLSKLKEINPLIYITKNDPTFKNDLEIKWVNGNKNDSILILGVSGDKIIWSDSINWSKNKRFGIELSRNFTDLNITNTTDILLRYEEAITKYWKRLSMEETYGYLKTEIEIAWYYQLIFILLNIVGNFYLHRYFLNNRI